MANTLKLHRNGAAGFIVWLDRSVHSRWFSESQPRKPNCEQDDTKDKAMRRKLCDPKRPKITVLHVAMNATGKQR